MASMVISTYLSLLPQNTVLLCCIVLCVGFFGIFLPYQERRKQQAQKRKPKPPEGGAAAAEPSDKRRLDQLESLRKAGVLSEEEYREKKRKMR